MSSVALDPAVNPDADGLVGSVTLWPSDVLPSPKYRFCDGAAVSRSEFSLLFSRIGTAHGAGDGSTTFNLPNYQGRFLVGLSSADADFDTVGETGGTKDATMPAHSHGAGTLDVGGGPFVTAVGQVEIAREIPTGGSGGGFPLDYVTVTTADPSVDGSSGSAGGTGNNCPPYTVTRYIIKVA